MKIFNFSLAAGLVGIGLLAAPMINAQSSDNNQNPAVKGNDKIVNLTGCLSRNPQAHDYSIKDANGNTYELLRSGRMNIRKHVGEQVMVTGTVAKANKQRREDGTNLATGYLRVNQIKRVSGSCS